MAGNNINTVMVKPRKQVKFWSTNSLMAEKGRALNGRRWQNISVIFNRPIMRAYHVTVSYHAFMMPSVNIVQGGWAGK